MNFIWIAVLVCFSAALSVQDPLNVTIYYESLCPDSVNFLVQQLHPTYKKIGSHLRLEFIPYGHGQTEITEESYKFSCQHGSSECTGNLAQACVLMQQCTHNKVVDFVHCIMSQQNPSSYDSLYYCTWRYQVNYMTIRRCMLGHDAKRVMAYFGNRTRSVEPAITFIPTIVFNGVFNQTLQNGAISNFLQTSCDLFKTKPSICESNYNYYSYK